ncbi:MBL fold metallo-hydrolase [bacterium]|nr:MBL fold metallo-hydrolase [bacterium]
MRLTWFGHSSFKVVTSSGTALITDPYKPSERLTYTPINSMADVVTVSHDHWDHSSVDEVLGSPAIVRNPGSTDVRGIHIEGFSSFHDERDGTLRGKNIIFRIEADNITLIHMGDLGYIPSDETLSAFENAEVIMIPSGGVYTIGPLDAWRILDTLKPNIIIPMHFLNSKNSFLKYTVDDFITYTSGIPVSVERHTVTVEDILSRHESTVLVMESAR